MAVSKRLRYEILNRDGFKCRYCGVAATEAELRVDHVIPKALGGSDDPTNLATACEPCNTGKTSSHPGAAVVADVADDALRWAAAMAEAAHRRSAELRDQRSVTGAVDDTWHQLTGSQFGPAYRPDDWAQSIVNLWHAGLDAEFMTYAVSVTVAARHVADQWRYYCGVCWREMDKRREIASSIVAADAVVAPEPDDPNDLAWEEFLALGVATLQESGGDRYHPAMTELSDALCSAAAAYYSARLSGDTHAVATRTAYDTWYGIFPLGVVNHGA